MSNLEALNVNRLIPPLHSFSSIRQRLLGAILAIIYPFNSFRQLNQAPKQPLTSPLQARPGKETMTIDWLLNMPQDNISRSNLFWLDNSHLVYETRPRGKDATTEIEVLDLKTGSAISLGKGSLAKPSPDGKWIAFARMEANKKQFMIIQIDGSQLKELYVFNGYPEYNFDFAWSPDSKQIVVCDQAFIEPWKRDIQPSDDPTKTSAIESDKLQTLPPNSEINIIDIQTMHSHQIFSVDALLRDISWFPNGESILFMKERTGISYNQENDEAWVQSLNLRTNQVHTLAEFDGLQKYLQPVASPDCRQVAFMYDADNPLFMFMASIGLVSTNLTPGQIPKIQRLTHELKVHTPKWAPNGNQIYVLRIHGAYRQIYAIDTKTGISKQITNAPFSIENFAISLDGSQLAWVGQDAHGTRMIRVATIEGQNVSDVSVISGAPKGMALSEVREIEWDVPDYPMPMRGLLLLPLNYREGNTYPLIVDIHGGGPGTSISLAGGILMRSPLEWQLWNAKGFAVFVPDFRSSAAYGSLAITRDKYDHNLIDWDVKDIVAGVDALIKEGTVDAKRTAVIGHSSGARRANWLTVSTHHFCAVVSKEGWADEWFESGIRQLKRENIIRGGTPVMAPKNYQKNSSLFHARGASTPTLFLMGTSNLGGIDTYDTVRWLYNALKVQGVQTQYVQYIDEGHVLERPANQRDALERSVRWIDTYLLGA